MEPFGKLNRKENIPTFDVDKMPAYEKAARDGNEDLGRLIAVWRSVNHAIETGQNKSDDAKEQKVTERQIASLYAKHRKGRE